MQVRLDPGVPLSPTVATLTRLLQGEPLLLVPTGGEIPNLTAETTAALAGRLDDGPGDGSGAATNPDRGRIVVATSGSSDEPKRVVLSAGAVRASAGATERRLSGPGSWVLSMPPWHIGGLQVLIRSALAGTVPASTLGATFTAARFAAAVRSLSADGPRYAALVPAQLSRLLEDRVGQSALRDVDAVLIGGGSLAASMALRARDFGAPIVTTYGMTETAGGCVYDGVPLEGVTVRVGAAGHLEIAGPMLAERYLVSTAAPAEPAPDPFLDDPDGTRWFRTDDLGEVTSTETGTGVVVHGRADDVIITGGHKVNPTDVDHALLRLPEVTATSVHGIPHAQWGSVVAAVVVSGRWPTGPADPALRRRIRERLRPILPAHALPQVLVVLPELPLLESGKPDRRSLISVLAAEVAE